MFYTILTILIIIVAILLGLIVLIQNPKGGGLNSSFGGVGQQILGARRSTDVVEKATWGLASALLVFCLCTAFLIDRKVVVGTATEDPLVKKAMQTVPAPSMPGATAPADATAQPAQAPADAPK